MGNQPTVKAHHRTLTGIASFSLTIFLSAFLLFQVQPLISKFILPWFGGTPAVWSASLLFFQTLLLGGYAFAHWLSAKKKWQLQFYLALLGITVLALLGSSYLWGSPLLPDDSWKPINTHQPFIRIITILFISVGLPYFLLASTSPLLQSWFKLFNSEGIPYRLYALSNFGSLLGLISYPFFFEPSLRLREQSWIWFALYVIYSGFCGYLGWQVSKRRSQKQLRKINTNKSQTSLEKGRESPTPFRKFLWVMLAACASILLLSVTNQLTQEVAVSPFLWVLPLSIYLISFIVTFSGEKWYPRFILISLLAVASLGVGFALSAFTTTGMFYQILILLLFLLLATLVLHGELFRSRPGTEHLTAFYLYISVGGVIGGLFVNLIAPLIFNGYWELHLGILLSWLLIILLLATNRPAILDGIKGQITILPLVLILAGAGYLLIDHINHTTRGVLNMQRNFYGVIRVRSIGVGDPPEIAYSLNHGTTSHGFQFQEENKRSIPTAYYGEESGIGLTLKSYQQIIKENNPPGGIKVGLIGLGTGTLAAYGESGDNYRFYEINREIIELALGEGDFFTYISDSPATFEIVPGDARISLEAELNSGNPGNYDILAVDAFSSDAIPVHLLTVEAINLYLQHLKPDGVLAIHISNRYLNLAPLVQLLAETYQLNHNMIRNARDISTGSYSSTWMLLSKSDTFFQLPKIKDNITLPNADMPGVRIWTDDYSNLVPLIKMEVFTKIR